MQAAQPARRAAAGAAVAPAARVTELTPAEVAKEEGNAAFKRGDLAQACSLLFLCMPSVACLAKNLCKDVVQ